MDDPHFISAADAARLIRRHYPDASGRQILAEIEQAGAAGEIRARGRQRVYGDDRTARIDHGDPHFIWFADGNSDVGLRPQVIPAAEWPDLTFFSRRMYPGVPHRSGLERALNDLDSVDELRSKSRRRLAWAEVELCRADVIRAFGAAEPATAAADRPMDEAAPAPAHESAAAPGAPIEQAGSAGCEPRDTSALRLKAKAWLAEFVGAGNHRDRDNTLIAMRLAHPGLGVRGSLAVWGKFTRNHRDLKLSRPGRKSKRNTNN